MSPDVIVRPSVDADLPAITEIYAHHVRHGTASFELEPPMADEMARRRADILAAGLPYLIAELAGRIVGYAYAGRYRPRPAYRCTLEDSVYVHPEHLHHGIGNALLPRLIACCEQTGARQMIAVIGDSANLGSVRLHERWGFRHAGVLRSVGFKHGRWLDTVLMQLALGAGDQQPPAER